MKEFIEFERKMLSDPKTFFPAFEAGFEGRSKIIWNEFIQWQKTGKLIELKFRDIGEDIVAWNIGEEHFGQRIDKFAPFTKEQYKNGLEAVYSFMNDRPQYFKFRRLEGMYNPLKLLLYKFL